MELDLKKMELGDATAAEARAAVSELLKEGSESSYSRLYAAMGAWLWKTLDGRRRDDELRQWFDIIRRTSAFLSAKNPAYAERFRAFYDLLEMSIATSKAANVDEILTRQHVVSILQHLQQAGQRPVEKAAIAGKLGLKPANLSRILHMMANARLVERTSYGKQAHFCITREGSIALSKREAALRPAQAAAPMVQQSAAEAGAVYRQILATARHDSQLTLAHGNILPDLTYPMPTADPGLGLMNLLQRLANLPAPPTPTPTPPATPPPTQAQPARKIWRKRCYAVQVAPVHDKALDAHRAHLFVEPVQQQKSGHFMLHAYKEENENHVD
ncbi:hypothetical protein [Bradyrhizobium sp. CCBAU 53421]|uniref:hypothetical protein n=1 Tax=Bradyrhizobium sp. CCBAU 53421 TaxID=1325120 RepID=UPI00188D0362|nr:hypothetical protein [Bradyrhizobium sp. CCBAU 53421]